MLWTKSFWAGAGERAIKTAIQTLAAIIAVSATGLIGVDYIAAASLVGAAVVASLATSIGNANFVAGPTAAIVSTVEVDPTPATGDAQHVATPAD